MKGTLAFDRKGYGMNSGIAFIKIANRVEVTVGFKAKQVTGPRLVYQQYSQVGAGFGALRGSEVQKSFPEFWNPLRRVIQHSAEIFHDAVGSQPRRCFEALKAHSLGCGRPLSEREHRRPASHPAGRRISQWPTSTCRIEFPIDVSCGLTGARRSTRRTAEARSLSVSSAAH